MILALLLQAAGAEPPRVAIDPPSSAAPPQQWSIQSDPYAAAPYPAERCTPGGSDVVVCARPNTELRLPLPAERGPPNGPRRAVRYLDGAEMPQGTPCAAIQQGCTTGLDLIGSARILYKLGKKIADPDAD